MRAKLLVCIFKLMRRFGFYMLGRRFCFFELLGGLYCSITLRFGACFALSQRGQSF